jgi:hypothetical protein
MIKTSFERWFTQQDLPAEKRTPPRAGRRTRTNETVVQPVQDVLDEDRHERLAGALALVVGTEAVVVLTDALGLDPDEALATPLDANRWLIAGALAELRPGRRTG